MHAVLLSNTANKHHFHCVLHVLLALGDNIKRALGRLRNSDRGQNWRDTLLLLFLRFGACRGVEHDNE